MDARMSVLLGATTTIFGFIASHFLSRRSARATARQVIEDILGPPHQQLKDAEEKALAIIVEAETKALEITKQRAELEEKRKSITNYC